MTERKTATEIHVISPKASPLRVAAAVSAICADLRSHEKLAPVWYALPQTEREDLMNRWIAIVYAEMTS